MTILFPNIKDKKAIIEHFEKDIRNMRIYLASYSQESLINLPEIMSFMIDTCNEYDLNKTLYYLTETNRSANELGLYIKKPNLLEANYELVFYRLKRDISIFIVELKEFSLA